jgi:hypothetical protein
MHHRLLSSVATLSLLLGLHASSATAEIGDFRDSGAAVAGDSLASMLDGIHEKRQGDFTVQVLKVKVLRIDVEPVEVFSEKAFRESGAVDGATYAIATHLTCSSQVDTQTVQGQKTNWYLFEDEKLFAFDNHNFGWHCVVIDQFKPASLAKAATERKLLDWLDRKFPKSGVSKLQIFGRGIRYARVGRVEDAEGLLKTGDSAFNTTSTGNVRREGGRTLKTADKNDRARSRERLVKEIAAAHGRIARGEDHLEDEGVLDPRMRGGEPTDKDRLAMAAETERRDQERKEKWELEKANRMYMEVGGGWVRVDDWRVERGPRDGETFVGFDEMKRIKAERKANGE